MALQYRCGNSEVSIANRRGAGEFFTPKAPID